MKDDEITTSEIRPKKPGFDRRDRTARAIVGFRVRKGESVLAEVPVDDFIGIGKPLATYLSGPAGEELHGGDMIELENGIWWKV